MWHINAARPVAVAFPNVKIALDKLSSELKGNASPSLLNGSPTASTATTTTDGLFQIIFGDTHKTPMILREVHELSRGKWKMQLAINEDDVYTFAMRVEQIDAKSLRLVPTDKVDTLPLDFEVVPTTLKFHTFIDGILFSTLDYTYIIDQFDSIPSDQLELVVQFDRDALPDDTFIVDGVKFLRSDSSGGGGGGGGAWKLANFEGYVKSVKTLEFSPGKYGADNNDGVRLVDLAHTGRNVEYSRHPVVLPEGVVMVDFVARNEDEQVQFFLQNVLLVIGFFYEPPWLSPARWSLYHALFPYIQHFYDNVVPAIARRSDTSNHDLDVAWRTIEMPRIWNDYKSSKKSAKDFLGLSKHDTIKIETLGMPFWGEERAPEKQSSLAAHWDEVIRMQKEAHGDSHDDSVIVMLEQEQAREKLYYDSVREVATLHASATLGQWTMLRDTRTNMFYEASPKVPIVYSQFILQMHMRMFDQRTPAQFTLPIVSEIIPFEAIEDGDDKARKHVYKRVFRAEDHYEVLISMHANPLFVILRPGLEIVPHNRINIAFSREDYPAPLYLPYQRASTLSEQPAKHRSVLQNAWTFLFGLPPTAEPVPAAPLPAAASELMTMHISGQYDLTAGWLDKVASAAISVDVRIDDAAAGDACPALKQIVSVLKLIEQDDVEKEKQWGLPPNMLVINTAAAVINTAAAKGCKFLVTREKALDADTKINFFDLDNLQATTFVDAAESLVVTRDPRAMLKAARRQFFSRDGGHAYGKFVEVTSGSRQKQKVFEFVFDIEAVTEKGKERQIEFLLSNDPKRVTTDQLLGLGMGPLVYHTKEAQKMLENGYYTYIVNEGGRRHTGTLAISVFGWRFLTRDGELFISKRISFDEPRSAVLWRTKRTKIDYKRMEKILDNANVKGIHLFFDFKTVGLENETIPVKSVDVKEDGEIIFYYEDTVELRNFITQNEGDREVWQLHTEFEQVSSQEEFTEAIQLAIDEQTPGAHTEELRAKLVGVFVQSKSLNTQVYRIASIIAGKALRGMILKPSAISHSGIQITLDHTLEWVPFPCDDNTDHESASAFSNTVRTAYYERLEMPLSSLGEYEVTTYRVLGWPSSAPKMQLVWNADRDKRDILVLGERDTDNVLFAVSAFDVVQDGSKVPSNIYPLALPNGFYNTRDFDSYSTTSNDIKQWYSEDFRNLYLVDSKTRVVFAVKFDQSPAVPVYGYWLGTTPTDNSRIVDRKDIDDEWVNALRYSVYSRHTRLPGTAYTGDWSDYYSSSTALPDIKLSQSDPRSSIVKASDNIVQYLWEGGESFAPQAVLIRQSLKMHLSAEIDRLETSVVPLVRVFPGEPSITNRVVFSDPSETPFDAIDLKPRNGSSEKVSKSVDASSQAAILAIIAHALEPKSTEVPEDLEISVKHTFKCIAVRTSMLKHYTEQIQQKYPAVGAINVNEDPHILVYDHGRVKTHTLNKYCVCVLINKNNNGAAAVIGTVAIHVLDILRPRDLPISSSQGLRDNELSLDMVEEDHVTEYEEIQRVLGLVVHPPGGGGGGGGSAPGGGKIHVNNGCTTFERDWRTRLTYLLLSPQKFGMKMQLEVQFIDPQGKGTVVTTRENAYLPVMHHFRTGQYETLMLFPPYSSSKGTRFGRIPEPVFSVSGSLYAPLSINQNGQVIVKLLDQEKETITQIECYYDLSLSFIRTTPFFSIVISDPNNTKFSARVFIQMDYLKGNALNVAGVSVEYSLSE